MFDVSFAIQWAGTPNFWEGREGKSIITIVNHITVGAFPGCLNWLQNPDSGVSSNYLVNRAGEIYQLVKDENSAWANGEVDKSTWTLYDGTNPNRYTLSIEHEGFDGTLTEEQYQATLWLQTQLMVKWNIPIDRDHIIGHYQIDSVNRADCPGPNFPWDRLMADLKGGAALDSVNIEVKAAQTVELKGVLINDKTYTPLRDLCEALGDIVQWDEATRTVTVIKGGS